jgi:Protein of unknown function (DUF2950)
MSKFNYSKRAGYARRVCQLTLIAIALASVCFASSTFATESTAQEVFSSPAAAAAALVAAAKNDDMKALGSILGPEAKEVISSGDPVADNNARDTLVAKYNQMQRLAYDDQGRVILYVGADNWPFPIPIIKKDQGWIFDTNSGKEELLYRRIGQNELYTIAVLRDLVIEQREYASQVRDGSGVKQFAQKIQSDPGKHNGLYWPTAAGEPESPIGPQMAQATAAGYKTGSGAPIPFHGYYYKVLTKQGKNAPGGAKNYVVNGKMTKGFAFLAYPADYRASGVMTFMINQDGIIVQKDLGPDTEKLAAQMGEFNPDSTWDQDIVTPGELEAEATD